MSDLKALTHDPEEIKRLQEECLAEGKPFVYSPSEESNEDYAHFLFVGKHEGKPAIFNASIMTLEMAYATKVYEVAEEETRKQFPNYVEPEIIRNEKGDYEFGGEIDEEAEEFKASVILEIEEDDSIKVSESVEFIETEYGIGIDVMLNVTEINDQVISKFVEEFNAGTLKLDTTLLSFSLEEEEE